MKTVIHRAETRGAANFGWLDARHTFSFGRYYNPDRMSFGVLRVLNDDRIAGGAGFPTHPHDNMEIVTIPLEGALEHKDSMGNTAVIEKGKVQVMSAGTGVQHSEYNKNENEELKLLQIWMIPNKQNVTPRYDEVAISEIAVENELYQILSPNPDDDGVWVHQNSWWYMIQTTKDSHLTYKFKDETNGLYIFLIKGSMTIDGEQLSTRDGIGIYQTSSFDFNITQDSEALFMEVPLKF